MCNSQNFVSPNNFTFHDFEKAIKFKANSAGTLLLLRLFADSELFLELRTFFCDISIDIAASEHFHWTKPMENICGYDYSLPHNHRMFTPGSGCLQVWLLMQFYSVYFFNITVSLSVNLEVTVYQHFRKTQIAFHLGDQAVFSPVIIQIIFFLKIVNRKKLN